MASNADTSLYATTNVVAIPSDTLRYIGVDTAGSKESAGILDVRVVGRDLHDESNDSQTGEANHEDATSFELVGEVTCSDTAHTGDAVRWYRPVNPFSIAFHAIIKGCNDYLHQLSLVVGIPKSLDDGRKEK